MKLHLVVSQDIDTVNLYIVLCLLIFSIVSPFVIDFKEPLNITSDEFALGIGESIIVGWDPHDLTEGLISVNDITVNIAIVCYMIQYTY